LEKVKIEKKKNRLSANQREAEIYVKILALEEHVNAHIDKLTSICFLEKGG
jgi:hypothetical protein